MSIKYLVFLLSIPTFATTWNVATTGSDITGTGSVGAPYLSIQKAINVMAAGDTITVANGTYSPNYGAEYTGTSTTSVTPSTGSHTFTTQSGKAWSTSFEVLIRVYETSNPANYMQCGFSNYSGTSMVINCASTSYFNCSGSCTAHTDWTIVPGNYTFGDNTTLGQEATNSIFGCGSVGSPIVIQATNVGGAIIDGGLTTPYYSHGTALAGDGVLASDTAFNFEGSCSYLTIKGFVIQNFFHSGALVNGALGDHIIFSQNTLQNIGNETSCIPSTNATCAAGGTGSTFGIEGVYAGRVPTGATITSNITWDRNKFINIGRTACTPTPCTNDYSHDHGLYIYDGPYTITNNIFYGMLAGWNIQFAPGSHDITVVGNTFIGGYNPVKDGCMMLWDEAGTDGDGSLANQNITIQNNIFGSCTNFASDSISTAPPRNITGLVFTFNLMNNSSAVNTTPFCTPGAGCSWTIGSNTLSTSATFVNGATHNYHLTNSSAGINIGTTVTDPFDFDGNPRPLGGAYDMGAYEVVPNPTNISLSAVK